MIFPPSLAFGSVARLRRSRFAQVEIHEFISFTKWFDVHRVVIDSIVAAIEDGAGEFVMP